MHISVLQKELLSQLKPLKNENFIDATFGAGGHSLLLLEKNRPSGRVLGIEADPSIYEKFQNEQSVGIPEKIIERLILVNDSYVNLEKIVEENEFFPINGILFDLGLSSWHLDECNRGFSFKRDEPLDMRYDAERNPLTAFEIINYWPEERIKKVLEEYGEESFAGEIAKTLVAKREVKPVRTTLDLVEVIRESVPPWYRKKKIHFATKSFQGLRVAVNDELENVKKALPIAVRLLEKGGRIAVISFHSLEDRIIKDFFKESSDILEILNKKPITSSLKEIKFNPRSRSAKLRTAQKYD